MHLNEAELNQIEAFLDEKDLNPDIQKELIERALQSEEDIKQGRVYTAEQVEARIKDRLGL